MRLIKIILILMITRIVWLPSLVNAQPQKDIKFKVCGETDTWTRPTAIEQRKHLIDLKPRYPQEIINQLGGEYWKYNIFAFITYPGGSGTYDIEQLSGLWKPQKVRYAANCDDYVIELNAGKIARIWTLNYKVINIKWINRHYIMQVKHMKQGGQVIQFSRQEKYKSLPLNVIDDRDNQVRVLFYSF